MRVGLVAEGVSDLPIFEGVLAESLAMDTGADLMVTLLQPRRDELTGAKSGGGWLQVKARCQQLARDGQLLAVLASNDLLVVHLDQDVLHLAEFAHCGSAAALCDEVHGWLGLAERHPRVVVALPAPSTDAWLLARVAPELADVETVIAPKAVLLAKGVRGGARQYRRWWGDASGEGVASLGRRVPEVARFLGKLEAVSAIRT